MAVAQEDDEGWTMSTLKSLLDERGLWSEKFAEERDRRYAEVALEREKALKIKEEADKAALALARADQTYKDEQANKLREQINSERNIYVTQDQLIAAVREMTSKIQPLTDFVSGQQSVRANGQDSRSNINIIIGAVMAIVGIIAIIFSRF